MNLPLAVPPLAKLPSPPTQFLNVPEAVKEQCGGISGYIDLVNYFNLDLGSGVTVSPKIIKV